MFQINVISRQPVYEQIAAQAERLILSGALKSGDRLPSVRSLSNELSVNPNTIQKAYTELDRRGIVISAAGRGCFVSEQAAEILREKQLAGEGGFAETVGAMKRSGVDKQTLISIIENIYGGDGK